MATILCLDDEASALMILEDTLQRAGHKAITAQNTDAAFEYLGRGDVDLIISDYRMPRVTGLKFLSQLKRRGYDIPLIMVTGYGSIEHAVSSIKAGAIDYITKPIRPKQLELAVEQALEVVRLRRENAALRAEVLRVQNERLLVGDSSALKRIMETLATVAPTRASVLLQGESGTGKELLARAIHNLSDRSSGPFISVNAAAMPEQLVESLLFGHEKGAFTGAVKQVKGAFERAHRGTLLLDEISEMRPDLQAKLLRVLQEYEFERVGGSYPIRVDVRVVATTNRDLTEALQSGDFREDLYYRLSVVAIRVPPLRERMSDIPKLANHFAQLAAREAGKEITGIDPEAIELLHRHDWPGNVRELSHAVQRAVYFSSEPVLRARDFDASRFGLTPSVTGPVDHGEPASGSGDSRKGIYLESFNIAEAEELLIRKALEATNYNRTQAAKLLGMSVRTLRNRLNT